MTDLRKAAEMALEALDCEPESFVSWTDKLREAREALRQALAQPEQEPVAWVYRGNFHPFDPSDWAKGETATPLYTAPPKREWVGLSDGDLEPMCDDWRIIFGPYVHDFAKTIETKLKEKNA